MSAGYINAAGMHENKYLMLLRVYKGFTEETIIRTDGLKMTMMGGWGGGEVIAAIVTEHWLRDCSCSMLHVLSH